jgi:hypothetical protein
MKAHFPGALLSTLIVGAAMVFPRQPDSTYLFDCGGWIQRVDGIGILLTPAKHVAQVDSTLPDDVRDGCSIHAGWYDTSSDRLVLEVQTQRWRDEHDSLPTKLLALETAALLPQATEARSLTPPTRPNWQATAATLRSMASPFPRSIGYLLSDGTTLLLQEVTNVPPARRPVELNLRWLAGTVSLNKGHAGATGRYALLDIVTRAQRGVEVSTTGGVHDHRVVCFTPSGKIYLAATRDTLLVLDVMEPTRRLIISDLTLDLYWTACAWT